MERKDHRLLQLGGGVLESAGARGSQKGHPSEFAIAGLMFVPPRAVIYIVVQGWSSAPESRSASCWSPICW